MDNFWIRLFNSCLCWPKSKDNNLELKTIKAEARSKCVAFKRCHVMKQMLRLKWNVISGVFIVGLSNQLIECFHF